MDKKCVRCPKCGEEIKRYDTVKRIVKEKKGISKWIKIDRYKCSKCNSIFRVLPIFLISNKHYNSDIIFGFMSGELTSDDIEYEDYPCESTVRKWISEREKYNSYYEDKDNN